MTNTQSDAEEVIVTFHPQEWHEYAGEERAHAHPNHDSVKFTVPLEDAIDENGNFLKDDTYASDALAEHENAPDWVNEWEGPFYITIG